MAGAGRLRGSGSLDFDGITAAMIMCFDYNDSISFTTAASIPI